MTPPSSEVRPQQQGTMRAFTTSLGLIWALALAAGLILAAR